MKISIITLFPELFTPVLTTSILGRASKKKLIDFQLINIRDFGEGKHQVVDGRPFGGGVGMVFKADVLAKAWKAATKRTPKKGRLTVLMSASGKLFKQATAQELSKIKHLIIVCGHYEGVDQRFIDKYIDEEISIGDYVLTGGEIPAMAVIDAVSRLLPGVLEKEEATRYESFSPHLEGLLEYPQYTRPAVFEKEPVPSVLISGNHQEIEKWRKQKSLEKTQCFRPDLLNILLTQRD